MAKDTAMNIRISSEDLDIIKQAAKDNGFNKYSEWCLQILLDAAGKASLDDELAEIKKRLKLLEEKVA